MPKKAVKIFIFFTLFLLFPLSGIFAQEFTKSAGMNFFNNGDYKSAITEIKSWISEHPESQDIATYYLAESYYNLGMEEQQIGKSRDAFRQAYKAFQGVLKYSSLKQRYPKIYYASQLKRGWCYFRRAETGEQPDVELDNAYINFLKVSADAPDSVLLQSYLMAGESRFREGIIRKFNTLAASLTQLEVNKILSVFQDGAAQFNKVLSRSTASPLFKITADIRLNDIKFQTGKIYQVISEAMFANLVDSRKQASASATALYFFRQTRYGNLFAKYSGVPQAYGGFLKYAEAMKWLNIYFSTSQYEDKKKFIDVIRKVNLAELAKEVRFRFGTADHNTSQIDENESFFNLYQNDKRSFYFQALPENNSRGIVEAYFWLGAVQFIVHQPTGIENLNTFVQRNLNQSTDSRVSILMDYARYWRGLLFLEGARDNNSRLHELEKYLNQFQPTEESLKLQTHLLKQLTKLELGYDVWQNVLQGGNSPDWFKEAAAIIQYLLRQAATVGGKNRLHYINQLNSIFYYTGFKKSNETAFYQGIAKSLEAEIQGDEGNKKKIFEESANLLAKVIAPYQFEARYIQGRSLFFAEQYTKAKKIFRDLINKKHSLRSLYYFAEILRENGYGNAAKTCYEIIKQKTQNIPDGKFWYLNADAAINLCENKADGSKELKGLNIQNVVFPDRLFDQSYEQLADRKFLRFQYLRQSLDLLKKYALPKSEVYLASAVPVSSIFRKRSVKAVPGIINELLRRETSVVDIFVMLPQPSASAIKVDINGKDLTEISQNHFRSSVLNVGAHVILTIDKENFYIYKKEFDVLMPGKQSMSVPLSEKVVFRPATFNGMPLQSASFLQRFDRNMIIHRNGIELPPDSKLFNDLSSQIQLRDAVYNPQSHEFYVIDVRNKKALLRYDVSGSQTEGNELFPLRFTGYDAGRLNEPEGITLDSRGNIYITDFATHRVVVFDSIGNYIRYFGGFGRNTADRQGEMAKFVFPTRIAVEEDSQGFDISSAGGKIHIYRTPFLLIADRYGIHRCDLDGNYIETVIGTETTSLTPGSVYSFGIDKYGSKASIFLGNREQNQVLKFSASVAK